MPMIRGPIFPIFRARKKACVVTGGTGSIGHALLNLLLDEGWRPHVLCRPGSVRLRYVPVGCHVVPCEVDELAGAATAVGESCDAFFHLAWNAAYRPLVDEPTGQIRNITGAISASALAADLGCLVFVGIGSQAQYGRTSEVITEKTPLKPDSYYGVAKCCAEVMSRIACRARGIRHVWARILSVYGPCDRTCILPPSLIRAYLDGVSLDLTPCGQTWDFLYADDAARALLSLAEKGRDGEAYCVASGRARPLLEYLDEWRKVAGDRARLNIGAIPYPGGTPPNLSANIGKLVADTGFSPQVAFEEGMRRTLSWYQEHQEAMSTI